MKKILQIVDVPDWAIGSLSKAIMDWNPQYEWKQIAVHPKDLEQCKIELGPIVEAIKWADVVDAQYWRTLSQLIEKIPELKSKKIVLTHHNEKNLLSEDWSDVSIHIAKTIKSKNILDEKYPGKVVYIPNSFDHKEFSFNENWPPEIPAIGYVGRIVPWKGLREIARAAYELGVKVLFMGKMDKPNYFEEIPEEHRANIDFSFMECSDEERIKFYNQITCYVGNSNDGREVGTLGFIEALACGVPVVTTLSGLANDIIKDGENGWTVPFENYEALKAAIKDCLDHREKANELRQGGWQTIKTFNHEIMARSYRLMFEKLMSDGKPRVSVIIPATLDRKDMVGTILDSLEKEKDFRVEAVVIYDQTDIPAKENRWSFPVSWMATGRIGGYNLAMSRNLGVVQSVGEFLVFCDSRMCPQDGAIKLLISAISDKTDAAVWSFGNKGANKKTFVENFSAVRRKELIEGGMFNERVDAYGGMSQEIRGRFSAQGFQFIYCESANAIQLGRSGLSGRRGDIISMKNLLSKLEL